MEIKTDLKGKKNKLFTQDSMPNPAFRNTFQTNEFRCVLKGIQLYDQCEEVILQEGECIVTFELQIINMTNEQIMIYSDDFMFQNDKNKEVYCLFLTTDTFLERLNLDANQNFIGSISFIAQSGAKYMTLKYQEYNEDWEGKIYKLKYAIP